MELAFNDKRLLGFFDKDFARCMGFLKQVRPGTLKDSAKVKEYQDLGDRLRERLKPIPQQDHPEVQQRRQQIAQYDAMLAAAIGDGATPAAPAALTSSAPCTPAVPEPPPTAPVKPAGDALRSFASLYNRWMMYLKAERPQNLAKPPILQKYRAAGAEMEAAIAQVADPVAPEAQAAREQVAAYLRTIDEMVATASAMLSPDDAHRVGRFRGEHATAIAELRACDRTVLGADGCDGTFHSTSKRLHDMLAPVENVDHPDAKAAYAALAEFDALLAEKTETSKVQLADLLVKGELFTAVTQHMGAFEVPTFPPRISADCNDDDVARFANGLLEWQHRLETTVPYFENVLRWAPAIDTDVLLRDKVRRFLSDKPRILREASTGVIADWQAVADKALAICPEEMDKGVLADGARDATQTLEAGVVAAHRLALFTGAFNGKQDTARDTVLADLQARATSMRPLCAKAAEERLRNARLPEALDYPDLLEIAQRLIKRPTERVVITRELQSHERERESGAFVYWENYDVFCAHAAIKEDDGTYRIYEYGFYYMRAGSPGTILKEWDIDVVWPGQAILFENIHLPPLSTG
ncbi:MAG: hypothetical protein NT140_07000 [Deltaproteobacteria bacterium]|nr:hypothetical protein [Deltaproteobacteria bacterium]